jgi:hypothetical protein
MFERQRRRGNFTKHLMAGAFAAAALTALAGPAAAETAWYTGSFSRLPMSGSTTSSVSVSGTSGPEANHSMALGWTNITPGRVTSFNSFLTKLFSVVDATSNDNRAGVVSNQDWCGVRAAGVAAGYYVSRYYDATYQRHYVIARDSADQQVKFWVNPVAPRNLVMQATHVGNDSATGLGAGRVFANVGARVLMINGAPRCASTGMSGCTGYTGACGSPTTFRYSDTGHDRDHNLFHVLHKFLNDRPAYRGTTPVSAKFVQFHQNTSSGKDIVLGDATGLWGLTSGTSITLANYIRANSTLNPTTEIISCQNQGASQWDSTKSSSKNNVCGEYNTQGIYSLSPSGTLNACTVTAGGYKPSTYTTRWLHVEADACIYYGTCNGSTPTTGSPHGNASWVTLKNGVASDTTWGLCNLASNYTSYGTSACGVGVALPRVAASTSQCP